MKSLALSLDGTLTAIESVDGETDALVDVYTVNGVKVKSGVKASAALEDLNRGSTL